MGERGAIIGILISKYAIPFVQDCIISNEYAIINIGDEGWGDKCMIIGGKSEG